MRLFAHIVSGWLLPIVLSVMAVSVILFEDALGRAAGILFPVTTPLVVTHVSTVPGGLELAGHASKVRDCDWRKTVFHLGTRTGGSIILTERPHLDKPKVNGIGELSWGRIFVPISPSRLNETFADAYHQCGWRPWQTITRFYN